MNVTNSARTGYTALMGSWSNKSYSNDTSTATIISVVDDPSANQTLQIALPVSLIVLIFLTVFISYRVYIARRTNDLRRRLFSLRRYDPTLNGSKTSKVQTPEVNHDPLLLFSVSDQKRTVHTTSDYRSSNTV